jgi:uncharacterized membrane protein YcaP (DUF421 family)
MLDIVLKGYMSLIFLFFIIKLLGKKQVSQLNVFDYVIGISLGNIAAEMTINSDISIINGLLAMVIYGSCSLFVSFITSKSIVARRFISGVPVVLIEHGKISKESLKKVKLDLNDLLQDAREDGIFDITKVDYAIMEASGKVTFLLKAVEEPLTSKDMNIEKSNPGLTANLIMDGKIMYNNLKAFGKDKKWLIKKIKEQGYHNIKDIFLLVCNNSLEVTIYEKSYEVGEGILE